VRVTIARARVEVEAILAGYRPAASAAAGASGSPPPPNVL
jgi:hypothetical protein